MDLSVYELGVAALVMAVAAGLVFAPLWLIRIPRMRAAMSRSRWIPMWLRP